MFYDFQCVLLQTLNLFRNCRLCRRRLKYLINSRIDQLICLGDIQKAAGFILFLLVTPCDNLWLLWTHALLHSNLQELPWNHLRTFKMKYVWFGKLPGPAVNILLIVWNLKEFAVKPLAHFYMKYLWVWKLPKAAWIHYWWFGISRKLPCNHLHILQRSTNVFGSFRRLLWIHYWWFGISKVLRWRYLHPFTMKY